MFTVGLQLLHIKQHGFTHPMWLPLYYLLACVAKPKILFIVIFQLVFQMKIDVNVLIIILKIIEIEIKFCMEFT